jgi:hypothetical protein
MLLVTGPFQQVVRITSSQKRPVWAQSLTQVEASLKRRPKQASSAVIQRGAA